MHCVGFTTKFIVVGELLTVAQVFIKAGLYASIGQVVWSVLREPCWWCHRCSLLNTGSSSCH